MIKAEIVGHSLSPQGDELVSVLATFPRIVLAEVNTHRMLSKNTSSSRAIPFEKMLNSIKQNPFIPIAFQKEHKGMQGNEYITDMLDLRVANREWKDAMNYAILSAQRVTDAGITKQLANRLLEPFMWTTMLITGSKEGWENFFRLRCPQYQIPALENKVYKSKKDVRKDIRFANSLSDVEWLQLNKGQAEIHMMALAEAIWDAKNESTPKQLKAGEWHIPFEDKVSKADIWDKIPETMTFRGIPSKVKISTAMGARTSYTIVGEEKVINLETLIGLHDRLISQQPPHSSPFEHCARAMDDEEFYTFYKGHVQASDNTIDRAYNHLIVADTEEQEKGYGWCYNLKGFIPYRYLVDNKINL